MKKVDIEKVRAVHFVGIGGIGMSALAQLFAHDNKTVTGSDRDPSKTVCDMLQKQGIKVETRHTAGNVFSGTDLVVYSDAVDEGSEGYVEREYAEKSKISTLSYFEALGQFVNQYYLIAVAGMHGKTTTTAMLVDIFEAAGRDPTAVVGSLRNKTCLNYRVGKGKYFIVEADEYRRHFLHFKPDILVILNIDKDHLDYYKNLDDIQDAFRALAKQVRELGYIVTDSKNEHIKPALERISARVIDYTAYLDLNLNLRNSGLHNHLNAAAASAVADIEKIEKEAAKKALEEFAGTWRRFEYKGKTKSGAIVYDDYAHHPAEIKATLKTFREQFPDKRITVVFQPHLFSRTRILFDEFAKSFSDADEVILAPIYAAREKNDGTISSEQLAQAVSKNGLNTRYFNDFNSIESYLKKRVKRNNLIVTMGAGDIYKVGESLIRK